MPTKPESEGVKRLKEAFLADKPESTIDRSKQEWNSAIDWAITQMATLLESDTAMAILDLKAKDLAKADKVVADSREQSYSLAKDLAARTLGCSESDTSVAKVLNSLTALYGDVYSRKVIYTNYVSRFEYNYQQQQFRIDGYQASIETLNSLKFV